jgi:hypothetical protein
MAGVLSELVGKKGGKDPAHIGAGVENFVLIIGFTFMTTAEETAAGQLPY